MHDRSWQPGDPIPDGYIRSRADGLPARDQGPWARDKLRFLKKYLPAAVGATKKKRGHTHYVDLFAGPGRNAWIRGNRYKDFLGSPLIALGARFKFKDRKRPMGFGNYHFCNIDRFDHDLLSRRLEVAAATLDSEAMLGELDIRLGDANDEIYAIIEEIPSWAYIAAFLDIEGPADLAFSTVRALKSRHASVDAYVLYPTGGLRRILPYDPQERKRFRDTLTRYYGTEEWESIVERRASEAQASAMDRDLLSLYKRQLGNSWKHVEVVMRVTGPRGLLYQMLFVYDHPAAGRIADSAARSSAQFLLFDEPK